MVQGPSSRLNHLPQEVLYVVHDVVDGGIVVTRCCPQRETDGELHYFGSKEAQKRL